MLAIWSSWLWPDSGGDKDKENTPSAEEKASVPDVKIEVTEDAEEETTPKATTTKLSGSVPAISLSSDREDKALMPPPPKPAAPSFPAANSAQRASSTPSAARTASKSASSLMAPPARPTPGLGPNSTASMRVPTGPLPKRGPPSGSQQRVSSSLSPNTLTTAPSANSRKRVLLKPGHSPMDWAALTRTSSSAKELPGVSTFQRVTPSQLKSMSGRKGKPAWSSWQGKVYNLTPYVAFHPGGEAEIMKAAGRDGEKGFMEVHPWVNWENMLGACLVGVMVPEESEAVGESELERLD